jgi:hypothetical protein
MPITRAKATALLNQREMALYDDSRANAIRGLDEKALSARIARARESRDRARDLVQRQKLSSRDRTGSKRGTSGAANQRSKDKVELTTDILRRFEAQLDKVARDDGDGGGSTGRRATRKSAARRADRRDARKATRTAATGAKARKAPAKTKQAASRASAQASAARRGAGKASAGAKSASTRSASKKAKTPASKTSASKKASKAPASKTSASKRAPATARKSGGGKLTPKQALKRTRALLEAKQARDREPKPWETIGGAAPDPGQPGFQSGTAARRALELHAGETRQPAINGSVSTRDRINQGKRDRRS